ncbi:MAG: 1-pyrroline-5-carboxylate dehydrogenase, partial [Gammaproteobacteria bacterium]|nr:1-pyrroline-5-carboxylate dehydrogenase [Gammaproteobacteria bacterium]
MKETIFRAVTPINEPVREYAPGSRETLSVKAKLQDLAGERINIPCVIGGRKVETGKLRRVLMPHDHEHVLGDFHLAGEQEL